MIILIVFRIIALLLSPFEGSILFQSSESKTAKGKAVFNKVSLDQKESIDIWTMKQSHFGVKSKKWDKIKIIVDKSKKPFVASYFQLENDKAIPLKADCTRCHSGGPRLIRPHKNSQISLKKKLILLKMNSLIKSYGVVKNNFKKFKHSKVLKIRSCYKCHNENGIRAPITEHQRATAEYLVRTEQMPPRLYEINQDDQSHLNEFLYGF